MARKRGGVVGAAQRFREAMGRWVAAGRPLRSRERIKEIHETKCKTCPHYRPLVGNNGVCGLCLCALNLGTRLNKIAWATEQCPDNPPRWLVEITIKEPSSPMSGVAIGEPTESKTEERTVTEQPQAALSGRERRKARRAERRARRAEARAAAAEGGLDHVVANPTAEALADSVERRRRRRDRRAAPPVIALPSNADPLEMFGRNSEPIGHALRNLWAPAPVFLVCGGPSLRSLDVSRLAQRGVVSLGVNNVAGFAPVRAFVCSDPPEKFHHAIWLDPAILKFVPRPKLPKRVRAKRDDGTFAFTSMRVADCPSTFAFTRDAEWEPENFLRRTSATWGVGKGAAARTGRPKQFITMLLGLRLACYLGARRVYLLGVDFSMQQTDEQGRGNGYAFDERRDADAAASNNAKFRDVSRLVAELRPTFDAAGVEIYNCNPRSSLTVFPHVSFDDAIADARRNIPPEPLDLLGWYDKDDERERRADDE